MTRPDTRFPRPGFALIELLTTIAVLTILLGMAAGLIKLLLKLDQSGREAIVTASDQARLARTWRDDAHHAASANPLKIDGDRLVFPGLEGQTIAYSIRPHDVLRELSRGDKVQRRELYRRPLHTAVRFETSTEAGRPLASIIFQPDSTRNPTGRSERIDAEVGRLDRQITRQP